MKLFMRWSLHLFYCLLWYCTHWYTGVPAMPTRQVSNHKKHVKDLIVSKVQSPKICEKFME